MATIELTTLSEHFDSDEIAALVGAIAEVNPEDFSLAHEGDSLIIESSIDDDVFDDFRDRLEANDSNADVYVPVDFEDVLTVGDSRVGSSQALLLVLDSLREDFFVDDGEDDEEEALEDAEFDEDLAEGGPEFEDEGPEEEDEAARYYSDENTGIEMKDEQLRHIWRAMHKGARHSVQKGLCLFVLD